MTRHLGSLLSDYVDRRLDAAKLAELDRHVVACQVCRAAADEERLLLATLRATPGAGVSSSLQDLLLGLAAAPPPDPSRSQVPGVPLAPASVAALRLPVVAPATPALHRSPLRATLLAGLAASASAAVAWGLTAPAAPVTADISSVNPVRRPATASVVQAGFVQGSFVQGSVDSFTRRQVSTPEPTERFGR